jgi:hypothetical protein
MSIRQSGFTSDSIPTYEKLEFVHFAIQEAMNGNMDELPAALHCLELLREVTV